MAFPPGGLGNRQMAPHIRLNSGSGGDLLDTDSNSSQEQNIRRPSTRSLTSTRSAGALRPQASQNSLYNHQSLRESAERLLPPSRSRVRRFRDDETPSRSPSQSGFNSRRTSWSSESSRDSRMGPFASPFDDSRAPSRAGSDDEGVNTQTVSEKYNILPSAGLLLFPEDVEKDDYLHNPDPNDKDGRMRWADLFSKRGLVNVGGLAFITLGIGLLFIGYPILCVNGQSLEGERRSTDFVQNFLPKRNRPFRHLLLCGPGLSQ